MRLLPCVLLGAACALSSLEEIQKRLQTIADEKSAFYNCSVSIGFKNADMETAAAGGIVDFSTKRKASVDDKYAWGSGTKPLTGASILKLISEGKFGLESLVAPLVDPIIGKMALQDPSQNFSKLADLWGEKNVSAITIGQMLNMTSGIPDFDTAKGRGAVLEDSLRQYLYENAGKAFSPTELMQLSWVANNFQPCVDVGPKWRKCYSSTNFMILGLILAQYTGGDSWKSLDQASFLPAELRGKLRFGLTGAPKDYTPVHGYDRTGYNMPANTTNNQDVSGVDGVFAGWTASDILGTASDIAAMTWAIYGPAPTILPKQYADLMAATAMTRDYGLATFNLSSMTGHAGDYGVAYGHLGATYGYQSQLIYFPKLEFVLAVATNMETNSQTQPKDVLCFAYNAVASVLLDRNISCTFGAASYYASGCNCTAIA